MNNQIKKDSTTDKSSYDLTLDQIKLQALQVLESIFGPSECCCTDVDEESEYSFEDKIDLFRNYELDETDNKIYSVIYEEELSKELNFIAVKNGAKEKFNYNKCFEKIMTDYPGYEQMINYIHEIKPAKTKEWVLLIEESKYNNNLEATRRLIEIYLKRILAISYDSSKRLDITLDDAFSLAIFGFIEAIKSFEFTRDEYHPQNYFPFAFHFPRVIKGYINNNFQIKNNYLKFGFVKEEKLRKIFKILNKEHYELSFISNNKQELIEDLNENYNFEKDEIELFIGCLECNCMYDDELISDPFEKTLMELVHEKDMKELLNYVLDGLTPREKLILNLRFGLYDGKEWKLREVGKEFNCSHERVRQIEFKALRKLKHPTRTKRLKIYWEDM